MPILYVCGSEPAVGKTTVALGIAQRLRERGVPVCYTRLASEPSHPDLTFVAGILGHPAVQAPPDAVRGSGLHDAAPGEVLLVEVPTDRVHTARGAQKVLLVAPYRGRSTLERIAATGLEPAALVFNAVPQMYVERVQEHLVPALAARGWTVLGVVPHTQLMLGVPVRALVERLQGRWLCGEEHGHRLVARLAIAGGMLQDALLWLSRRPHNALICKGDRADLPLTALQAGSVAIILTEGLQPGPQVLAGARERGVPVISVRQHAIRALELIEDLFTTPPVHYPEKAATARTLVERFVVLDRLAAVLGLAERIGDVAGAR